MASAYRKKTSPEIIAMLNDVINASLAVPDAIARIAALGGAVMAGSQTDYGSFLAEDTLKWEKVVKAAGLRPG
jgi:tripartite-type tricarboxylate transporter receptor subunit TctC